ncbi:HlyD family efflux transporter periplasmic adaptor subunit [Paracoccus sp. SCSIO 75233]|uniref:HlyD family efflux transporter periplasmic adaptor subunit n=1 Tax=Paracoccus sp. SCSIO 75233 TaxID=3017782 RepID=UPI0022F13A38|nr:HlyD family efflux transporter periplasmic adaptor subunit [Paracoccus sp. SCSIO 75233]WBU53023.1 HlyD family efflux transporter periplasmic adaptor subunit [Paracoccus sp. SCSIO 75233]
MKKIILLLVLAGAAAGGSYWWSQRETTQADELTFYGNVDIRQVALAFEGSGRILAINVEEGDRVTSGQVLGVLDTQTLELQAKAQEATVEAQRQALLKLRNGSRPEEIAQARAQLASAEASSLLAEQELSRATRLWDSRSGAASQQSVDEAEAKSQAAKAAVDQAEAALEMAEAGARPEDISAAAAQLQAAKASLELLRHQIGQGQLRAPADAVVRSRLREPGDMITAQSPVFSLALTQPKWVRIYVSETDLGHIQPGIDARVITDTFPDEPVTGKVGYMSSVAEFTPKSVQTEDLRTNLVYEVHVIVEDEEDRLRLGQPATVEIISGSSS